MGRTNSTASGGLTEERIKAVAWEQIARQGMAGFSLRGIARELGVTAPAIYNYFPRLEDLITALIVEAFTALAETMEAAEAAVESDRWGERIVALCLAYRRWALEHRTHFQMIYGNPIPGYTAPEELTIPLARRPFLGMFRWFIRGYEAGELHIPDERRSVPGPLASAIGAWCERTGMAIPDALVALVMSGWASIHGLVMLELFGHIQPLVGEGTDFYRYEVNAFLRRLAPQSADQERSPK